jgi:hypothetical protein
VILIAVSLQRLIVTGELNSTWLVPCVVPKPEPVITISLPTPPVVAETLAMQGMTVSDEVETLSKVAIAEVELEPLVTANPMYTLCVNLRPTLPV